MLTSSSAPVQVLFPMSDVHVCPYPRRGPLSQCTPPRPQAVVAPPASMDDAATGYSLDIERISRTLEQLEVSGWYYGRLSWQQATELLRDRPLGTFLVRDSSDPMYLFALSVQTERGPTSIRIHYEQGQFKLDAEELLEANMPLFDCVVKLVDYYVRLSRTDKARAHVWLDVSGRRDRQIRLEDPLYRRVPSLVQLCRLAVNAHVPVQRINRLGLPNTLANFVTDYPYLR